MNAGTRKKRNTEHPRNSGAPLNSGGMRQKSIISSLSVSLLSLHDLQKSRDSFIFDSYKISAVEKASTFQRQNVTTFRHLMLQIPTLLQLVYLFFLFFFTHFISIWLDNSSNTKYWSN